MTRVSLSCTNAPSRVATLSTVLCLLCLAGCAVGPDVTKPRSAVPESWVGPTTAPASQPSAAEVNIAQWWTVFNDATLTSLIERAFNSNLDLRIATARIRQARASRGIAVSGIGPTVDASGSFRRSQASSNGGDIKSPAVNSYQVGFDAGWEIDIFGGVRRGIEAADAELQAAVENRRDVLVTLAAEVARNYVELRTYQQRIAIAGKNLEAQKHNADLTRKRFANGFVSGLDVTNAEGQPVVLRNVVSIEPRTGPVQIERKDQERLVTVRANIQGRDMGSILADIRQALGSLPAPRGFSIAFGGGYEEQQKTFRELQVGLVLALVLVYMVMACLYESLRDPFVVMFSVPLAIIGVVLMLFLTNTTFNMQSYIGCIMLGGIVVNNAILLVDCTNMLRREEGMAMRDAIEEAGRRRLRPILMTALTTIFGLIPLALGLGEGGEAQAPLARAVIGGLASSTLITLVVVPVIYSLFERGLRPLGGSAPQSAGAAAEATA